MNGSSHFGAGFRRTNAYFLAKFERKWRRRSQTTSAPLIRPSTGCRTSSTGNPTTSNASLYVDYDGSFRAPREVLTAEHLDDVFDRNGAFMSMAFHKLTILLRWKADLDVVAAEVANLWAKLSMDELDRDKPETLAALKKRLAEAAEKGLNFRPPSGGG